MQNLIRHYYKRNKFLYLLTALLLFLLVNPFLTYNKQEMFVFGALFTLVILFCVYIIQHDRWLIVSALVLAALTLVSYWSSRLTQIPHQIMIVEHSLTVAFFLLITITVLKHVIQDKKVNLNTLCGAISGYMLIGIVWTFIYSLIELTNPHAFNISPLNEGSLQSRTQLFIYYSFTTQSTLGFGDITPVSNIAKTFSWLQAVFGQIYLTVWIAQLVGLHIVNKVNRIKNKDH